MHHLIVGGVFERHPELQVVWTEMWGLRWVVEELAQMTLRLRNVQSRYAGQPRSLNYSHTFGSPVVDTLSLTPLEYFRRNCSIGASMLPRHDVKYCGVLGIDRIMWGTDSPHPGRVGAAHDRPRSAPPCSTSPRPTSAPCSARPRRRGTASTSTRWHRSRRRSARRSERWRGRSTRLPELPGVAFTPEDPLEALLG